MISEDSLQNNIQKLDSSESFADIFSLVKTTVVRTLGQRRSGLMLYLSDLPPNLGAYHGVGSNTIVINRVLLKILQKHNASHRDVNSFIYTILLHEYLHSLGYIDEQKVRHLCHLVAKENFGADHPATRIAQNPMTILGRLTSLWDPNQTTKTEAQLIKDFEIPDNRYIV
jgi:hypothetical protein